MVFSILLVFDNSSLFYFSNCLWINNQIETRYNCALESSPIYTYVLNNPLKYTDPSGYRPTGIFEEEARLTEGRNSGGSNWNPFAGFDPFTGKYNPYHKYSGFNSSFTDASMVGRYSRNPGPTGVHYDKTTNKLYYSYQDPITGKDNAYYTDKEGKVVSSDDGGHYEWRTRAVYYDNKYLIYTRNGVKKTTLDYDVINYKHYLEFVPDVDDDLPLIRSPHGIDGPESTSWKNMGKWARYLSDNFDRGSPTSKRRETGEAPWPIQTIVGFHPLLNLVEGGSIFFTGYDLRDNEVIVNQYVAGLWLMFSSSGTLLSKRMNRWFIITDQVVTIPETMPNR